MYAQPDLTPQHLTLEEGLTPHIIILIKEKKQFQLLNRAVKLTKFYSLSQYRLYQRMLFFLLFS